MRKTPRKPLFALFYYDRRKLRLLFLANLAGLALVIVFSWLGPYLERRREEKRFESHVRSEAIRARAEGRTISGFKVENGVPVTIWRD